MILLPSCWGPLLILLPALGIGDPRECRGDVAFLPSFGPPLSGIPNAKRGEQNQKWSPTKGNKIRSGCLTFAFSRAQKRAKMLRHPCNLRDPQCQARGAKSEVVPNIGEQYQKCSPHPYLLGGPKEGGNATSPLHSQGSPTPSTGSKIRSGCLTPTFSGAKKRAEMLHHPCILDDPERQARGGKSKVVPNKGEENQKWLPHPYLLGGPEEGRNATPPLHSRGSPMPSAGSQNSAVVPNKGEQYQKWLPHTCLLRGVM